MAQTLTADIVLVTADSTGLGADGGPPLIPSGWPCATLPANPSSVADLESSPSADDLLPQILPLAPRGPAWGTDEAGDGSGASPVQRRFWRALAAWAAEHLGLDWAAATQTFPSAITYTLPDWERELGLPNPCSSGQAGAQARIAAVRAKFAAQGGQSPAYFVCLAAAAGYAVTIEEPTQFLIDVSEVVGGDPVETWFEVSAVAGEGGALDTRDLTETWFLCDEAVIGDTPLEAVVIPAIGDGDPLEALVVTSAADDAGDQVAGGFTEAYFAPDDGVIADTPLESLPVNDPNGIVWVDWIVHVGSLGETWFRTDEGEIASDPLEGFLPAADLECLLRGLCPPHTRLTFSYALPA